MLENGNSDAAQFLIQLDQAEISPWRCPCGCPSIAFKIGGMPPAPSKVHVLGDFIIVKGDETAGIFIFESEGILAGIDVHSSSGYTPEALPEPEDLMTYEAHGRDVLSKK